MARGFFVLKMFSLEQLPWSMTIGCSPFVVIIILMVVLRRVKLRRRQYLCRDIIPFLNQQVLQYLRGFTLRFVLEEHSTAVLRSYIRTLAVTLGWVVRFKEYSDQFLKAHLSRVKDYMHGFIVPSAFGTHLSVRRVLHKAPSISARGGDDSGYFLQVEFGPPKTT